jgi:hypothetical protein
VKCPTGPSGQPASSPAGPSEEPHIVNAHRINHGQTPELEAAEPGEGARWLLMVVRDRIPAGFRPDLVRDVQVLSSPYPPPTMQNGQRRWLGQVLVLKADQAVVVSDLPPNLSRPASRYPASAICSLCW